MNNNKDEIVLFENGELALEVNVSPQLETVWLSSNQMALLYGRDEKTIRKHVNKIFTDGELERESNTQKMRVAGVSQPVAFYNLDVIISVGYRVNSKQGIAFRKWANSILKQYIIQGYNIDTKEYDVVKWNELENVQYFYNFFKKHEQEFEEVIHESGE